MRTPSFGLALLMMLGLGALIAIPTGAAEKAADQAKIKQLVDKMGSGEFDEREKATVELDKIGVPALEALKKAAQSEDAEVRTRATELVQKIERRNLSAVLLAPKKVHLVYKDMPVTQAVADFAKKSGYPIQLEDPEGKLKSRKITLDTGEVTFWQAMDKFCEKAGLAEFDPYDPQGNGNPGVIIRPPVRRGGVILPQPGANQPAPPAQTTPAQPPAPPAKPEKEKQAAAATTTVIVAQAQVAVAFAPAPAAAQPPAKIGVATAAAPVAAPPAVGAPGAAPGNPGPATPAPGAAAAQPVPVALPPVARPGVIVVGGAGGIAVGNGWNANLGQNQIILVDAKAKKEHATDYVGAVRIRATDATRFFGQPNDKEILLGLKVTPEPKLTIEQILSVRVDKALDDKGQTLTQAMDNGNQNGAPGFGGGAGAAPGAAVPAIAIARIPRRPVGFGSSNEVAAVRLKKGEKASTSLKELKGVLSAQVLAPAQDCITVEKIMEAAGKNAKGAEGGEIRIKEVTKNGGQITIKFELDPTPGYTPAAGTTNTVPVNINPGRGVPLPGGVLPPNPAPARQPKQGFQAAQPAQGQAQAQPAVQVPPGVIMKVNPTIARLNGAQGVSLKDEKGNDIAVISSTQRFPNRAGAGGAAVRENVMVFQLAKDQVPAKLVFSGSKSVNIDIPFSLTNVKLP